jgi:pantothenate synthetase
MKRGTLIEHKETIIIREENGLVSLSYNVLLTTQEANTVIKLVVIVVTTKSTLTCTHCGKTSHSLETCHNRKKEVSVVPTTTVNSVELVQKTKTQLVKLGRILVCYPYRIYSSAEHRSRECPQKIKVQNMFRTKPIRFNTTTTCT